MAPGAVRVVRDRATWVSYSQMAAYGAFIYGFGAAQVLLRDEQGTTRTISALHGSAFALGLIVMSGFNGVVTQRLGRGRSMRLGSLGMALGILGYTSGLSVLVTVTGVFVTALGGALVIGGLSAFLTMQQGPAAPTALSEATALAAIAGLVTPLLLGLLVAQGIGWRPALWLLVVWLLVQEVVRGRDLREYGTPAPRAARATGTRLPPRFWWAFVTMLPAAGIEFCIALWAADLLRQRGGLESGAAAAALAAFALGLLIGRVVGSRLARRMSPETLLIAAFALSGVAFLVLWASTQPVVMLVFLFVTGCGVALHWPLGIGRVIRSVPPADADRAAGFGNVSSGLSVMAAPFALGALADALSLHTAFLIVPLLAAFGVFLVAFRPVPLRTT